MLKKIGIDKTPSTTDQINQVSFKTFFLYWLKLGFISFGGPAGQISMMHQELVENRHWISERRFLHALNFSMLLPGPEAQQLATYIGWLMRGIKGGLLAGILFVLPSLIILIALAWVYLVFGDVALVQGILYGVKPAVTAIVLFAAYRIGSKTLNSSLLMCIALFAFIAIFFFDIAFPLIVIFAGIFGYIGVKFYPESFAQTAHYQQEKIESIDTNALINDSSVTPKHALFARARLIRFVAIGLSIWLLAIISLIISFGWENTLTQMSWFFTKAALVTFGGAYAVLPYVYQGGVEEYTWLTATQMIDGLALGETTPGPLIMVVTFIGFIGGWTKEVFGPEAQLLAGVVAALIVTFFTFLPSFLFVFIFGPLVEATRGNKTFSAPLTSITAAVVGVIVNLACFFAYHVYWPEGIENRSIIFESRFDWFAACISAISLLLLVKYKMNIIKVILFSAMMGASYFFMSNFII